MSDMNLVFGIHAVKALLEREPERIRKIYLSFQRDDGRLQAISKQAEKAAISVVRVSKQELDELVEGKQVHQGVVAECTANEEWTEADLSELIANAKGPVLLLILDGVQDPHNLGACLRSANAFGVNAVIAPKDRAVGLTSAVRKVASGAAEVTPFIQVTNLSRTLRFLKEQGVWLVGTTMNADKSIAEIDLKGSMGIVLGNEGEGMRRLTEENCDFLARIPMAGTVESLNVSVSAGICLYEARRQRGPSFNK